MRTFDYYCFVDIEIDLRMHRAYANFMNLSDKTSRLLNSYSSSTKMGKLIKDILFPLDKGEIKKISFAAPKVFLEFCDYVKKHYVDFEKVIEYNGGLYSIGKYTFFGMYKKEIEEAVRQGKFLLYAPEAEVFLNINGEKVDIRGKNIFPRTTHPEFIKRIQQMGAFGVNTILEESILYNWFSYITVDRDMRLTTLRELIDNPFLLRKYQINDTVFLKTLKKKFSDVCRISRDLEPPHDLRFEALNKTDTSCVTIDEVELDEQIIISKPITPTKDEYGIREWRVFVIDNELQSISRRDANKSIEIENEIVEFANKKIEQNKGKIPCNHVMDIMEYIDEHRNLKLDIVELNPMTCAWAFFDNNIVYGNSVFDKLDDHIDESLSNVQITKKITV